MQEAREYRMREALAPLRDRFQFIVLDCPPALDLLTLNALVAADAVLIPMQAEYFALEGISELLDTIERIRAALNPGLGIEGVVLTMLDERTNLAQQVMVELKNFLWRQGVQDDCAAQHSARGSAQPWQGCASVRSAIERCGELHHGWPKRSLSGRCLRRRVKSTAAQRPQSSTRTLRLRRLPRRRWTRPLSISMFIYVLD